MRAVGFLLVASCLAVFCGRGLPSTTPLGGTDPGEPDSGAPAFRADAARDEATPTDADADDAAPAEQPDAAPPTPARGADGSPGEAPPPAASHTASGPGCDDSRGDPGDCDRALTAKCPEAELARATCRRLVAAFKPRVAEELVTCLRARNDSGALCDVDATKRCGLAAAREACTEPSARSACDKLVRSCPPDTSFPEVQDADVCTALLSSFRPDVRAVLETCLRDECSFSTCVERVVSPAR